MTQLAIANGFDELTVNSENSVQKALKNVGPDFANIYEFGLEFLLCITCVCSIELVYILALWCASIQIEFIKVIRTLLDNQGYHYSPLANKEIHGSLTNMDCVLFHHK